eukprot:Blabericola_migrator_1__3291@NODE_196_length_11523_cov_74_480883_g169_i0_p7_GENE_NODE_196_length_11523_cov_74_480883_g169_i0NODE_196_length_11523_cov_74_480883_g169_i0_p7_ORF_typecomplete_len125_score12_25_NODE_196_length_11523_cov_74_480883_g169_i085678941
MFCSKGLILTFKNFLVTMTTLIGRGGWTAGQSSQKDVNQEDKTDIVEVLGWNGAFHLRSEVRSSVMVSLLSSLLSMAGSAMEIFVGLVQILSNQLSIRGSEERALIMLVHDVTYGLKKWWAVAN